VTKIMDAIPNSSVVVHGHGGVIGLKEEASQKGVDAPLLMLWIRGGIVVGDL
jgi:hypothetical protein